MAQRPPHLRVAKPGEKLPPAKKAAATRKAPAKKAPARKKAAPPPKNITEALDSTDRDLLVAMRKALAKQLDAGQIAGNSIPSAYRELRELTALIRASDAEAEAEEKRNGEGRERPRRSFDASAV